MGAQTSREQQRVHQVLDALDEQSRARASLFDRHYFEGGAKVGGYAGEGYWDFPCHMLTAQVIQQRQPESVLELGCARGYVLKILQDRGLRVAGLEISHHCHLTRALDDVFEVDVCGPKPWPLQAGTYDLCFSLAFLEHVPENRLAFVLGEMQRTCKRGLHGIDFGASDDGFDKTHCLLRDRTWWTKQMPHGHEILDKEEFERGVFPQDVLVGDGRLKVNVGSHLHMRHFGWENIDLLDLSEFAKGNGYRFRRHDVRQGLPYMTSTVDLMHLSHFLPQLTYHEAQAFLRECRRVLRPPGGMRIACVDAGRLLEECQSCLDGSSNEGLEVYDEAGPACAAAKTQLTKLWALTSAGRASMYDLETLANMLLEAGFEVVPAGFRKCRFQSGPHQQILRETVDGYPCFSFYVDATPRTA